MIVTGTGGKYAPFETNLQLDMSRRAGCQQMDITQYAMVTNGGKEVERTGRVADGSGTNTTPQSIASYFG